MEHLHSWLRWATQLWNRRARATTSLPKLSEVLFSDLSASKLRPVLVVAASGSGRLEFAAQVTSNPYSDGKAIEINDTDFRTGSLHRVSYIRPGKLFTANEVIFRRFVGILHDRKLNKVRSEIVQLIQGD